MLGLHGQGGPDARSGGGALGRRRSLRSVGGLSLPQTAKGSLQVSWGRVIVCHWSRWQTLLDRLLVGGGMVSELVIMEGRGAVGPLPGVGKSPWKGPHDPPRQIG